VREVAELLQRVVDPGREAIEHLGGARRILVEERARELHLDPERDHVLLRAVVEVPFDRAPRGVARGDDPAAGGLELVGLAPDLLDRLLER
jgi:hypothetical protein